MISTSLATATLRRPILNNETEDSKEELLAKEGDDSWMHSDYIPVSERHEYTVDDALTYIGIGRKQYIIFLVLGFVSTTFAANLMLMTFLLPNVPLVRCEWKLSNAAETMLSMVVFMGMMLGSSTWGAVADVYGRRIAAAIPLIAVAVSGVLAFLSPNVWFLIAVRILAGFGSGGNTTTFTMFSEFLPADVRGQMMLLFNIFWGIGSVFETSAAWLMLSFYGWRSLAFLNALPAIALFPAVMFLPESPRFLIAAGQQDKAMHILKHIASVNGKELPYGTLKAPNTTDNTVDRTKVNVFTQIKGLVKSPFNRVTPLIWTLGTALGLGYYTTILLASSVHSENSVCIGHVAKVTNADFRSILIDSTSEVPGVLLASFLVNKMGRIRSMQGSLMACCVSMILLFLFPSRETDFLFIGRLFANYTVIYLYIFTPEVFPSSCRCLAMGSLSSLYQIGASVSPFIANNLFEMFGLNVVAMTCASLFMVAFAITQFLIPFETAGLGMRDEVEEITEEMPDEGSGDVDGLNVEFCVHDDEV